MNHVWERTFDSFAGPGLFYPAEMMRISENEAKEILASLNEIEWLAEQPVDSANRCSFSICNAVVTWTTVLFHGDAIIGFYSGSYLWIENAYRGLGFSTPLILTAALHRGGKALPPGVVSQGYTAAGLAAHRTAYRQSVLTAQAEGLPVPGEIIIALHKNSENINGGTRSP
jgi:hypothetical protein